MEAGPRRNAGGERAVVVAADVVGVPEQRLRVEAMFGQPIGEGDPIERGVAVRSAHLDRDRESPRRVEPVGQIGEPAKLFAIGGRQTDRRLDPFLPSSVEIQALLRRVTEVTLLPRAVRLEHAELREQLANVHGARTGHRHVVRAPRVRARLVLAPARVAARLCAHLEQHELIEPLLLEPPRGAQAGDAAADDDDRNANDLARRRQRATIADRVAEIRLVVHERAGDRSIGFDREPDERRGRRDAELASRRFHRVISRHSASSVRTST